MAIATVTVNGTEYTVQSGKNFRLGFVHYYVRLMHMDGINYTERTVYGLAVYSGNASISFSCIDDAGNESRITATESTTGDHYAASPATLTSKLGRYGPVEISGFLEGTVFIGETYEVPYEDWTHDLNAGQLIGFTEAMAKMPPVCNAQFPVIVTQPTGVTVEQGAAVTLTCAAEVTDGGVLSYVWHGDNTVQGESSSFTPPTDTVGEIYYQCVVTNTLTDPDYGTDSSGTASEMVKVTVTAADTGGDTGDTEDPGDTEEPGDTTEPEKYPILDHINGYLMAICGRPIQWPQREPVAHTYNLLDFGGSYYSAEVDNDVTYAYFDAGNFPLQSKTEHSLTQASDAIVQHHGINLNGLPLKVGQRVEISVLFPAVSFGELVYDQQRYSYSFSTGAFGATSYVEYNWDKDGVLKYSEATYTGGLLNDYSLEAINNAAGGIIGFKLSGTLAADWVYANMSCWSTEFSNAKPFSFTSESVYSSYDDFKITVYE